MGLTTSRDHDLQADSVRHCRALLMEIVTHTHLVPPPASTRDMHIIQFDFKLWQYRPAYSANLSNSMSPQHYNAILHDINTCPALLVSEGPHCKGELACLALFHSWL